MFRETVSRFKGKRSATNNHIKKPCPQFQGDSSELNETSTRGIAVQKLEPNVLDFAAFKCLTDLTSLIEKENQLPRNIEKPFCNRACRALVTVVGSQFKRPSYTLSFYIQRCDGKCA